MMPFDLFNAMQEFEYFNSGDDVDWLLFISDIEKVIYLFFQPTRTKRDWENNFNFPVKVYKNQKSCIKASRGWGDAWKSCNDEIMEVTIKAVDQNPDYDFIISGWSLGGAMSVLAAEDFYYRTGKNPTLITFGSPKPCFGLKTAKYIKKCCNGKVLQYADRNDIVTYLPPFPGFSHVKRVTIGEKFSIKKLLDPTIYHCIYGDADRYIKV